MTNRSNVMGNWFGMFGGSLMIVNGIVLLLLGLVDKIALDRQLFLGKWFGLFGGAVMVVSGLMIILLGFLDKADLTQDVFLGIGVRIMVAGVVAILVIYRMYRKPHYEDVPIHHSKSVQNAMDYIESHYPGLLKE